MKKLILAGALLACSAAAAAAPSSEPKLILAISVDQFSSEVFRRYRAAYTAGLKTLAGGIAYPAGYQSQGVTETCPGHSTILTGRHPAATGIIANSWYDRSSGSSVYCVSVPGAGPDARGHQRLKVTSFGDWLRRAKPGARSFAVAGKDRAAITMAGKHADGVYWWTDGTGFTTSPHAGPADPVILEPAAAFNAALVSRWRTSPPQLWPAPSPACAARVKRQQFGQLTVSGSIPPDMAKGVTAAEEFWKTKPFSEAMRSSPTFDAIIVDFALDLIARHRLGRGRTTDMLAIGLSATDYVGHRFGNGGTEMCVQQAALDGTIGRLIHRVEAMGIPFLIVLTADHGATDAAERHFDEGGEAYRIDDEGLMMQLDAAVASRLGLSGSLLNTDDAQQIYITADPARAPMKRVGEAAADWLKARHEVRHVFTRAEVEDAIIPPGTPPDQLTMVQRFHRSFDPDRSGDIAVVYAQRASYGVPHRTGQNVAGHGSPWDHDRQVPILFWWPGAPSETREAPVETVDIAPTLAAVAGIKVQVPVDGRCLDLGWTCSEAR